MSPRNSKDTGEESQTQCWTHEEGCVQDETERRKGRGGGEGWRGTGQVPWRLSREETPKGVSSWAWEIPPLPPPTPIAVTAVLITFSFSNYIWMMPPTTIALTWSPLRGSSILQGCIWNEDGNIVWKSPPHPPWEHWCWDPWTWEIFFPWIQCRFSRHRFLTAPVLSPPQIQASSEARLGFL